MTFSNNIIQATLDGFSGSPIDEYVLNGIIVDNTVLNAATQAQAFSPIMIQNNKLYQVHNGIHTQNWRYDTESYFNNKIYTTDNYISLRQIEYPNNTPQDQFGIRHELNDGGQIQNNTVDGFDNSFEGWYGIMAEDLVSPGVIPSVLCNSSRFTGSGIVFTQAANIYYFGNNTMNNNQLGYVLNGADIDEQGDNTYACGNLWTNYSAGFKTFTMGGADPLNSVLWIDDSDPDQDPTGFNWSDGSPVYDISNGLEPVGSNGNNAGCSAPQNRTAGGGTIQYNGNFKSNSPLDSLRLIALLERMVTDSFVSYPFSDAAKSIAKQRAYSILSSRPALANRSTVLQNFNANSHNRNIGTISRIENAIAENRLQQASQLLNHLQPQNTVETNTKNYLTVYLNHKLNRFTVQDSLELIRLSNGCVARDGFAVTRARALYRLKSKYFTNFFDDCGTLVQPRLADVDNVENTKIAIYPNPSSGDFIIKSSDNGKAGLFIYSIDGKLLYQQNINDIAIENKVSIELDNGLYFISIKTENEYYITKLVIIR
jgi:hypothetical protein